MCEPTHSIVQFPNDYDDSDLPFGHHIDKESRLKAAIKGAWGKTLGRWFHFSKVGSGHSGALMLTGQQTLMLPKETKYEGIWWERDFKLDDRPTTQTMRGGDAFACAREYHDRSCMGSLSLFRRFLEQSMLTSTYSRAYVELLIEQVFNEKGRNEVIRKLKRVLGARITNPIAVGFNKRASDKRKKQAIDCVMGFTRKRELYLPHFADDTKLW